MAAAGLALLARAEPVSGYAVLLPAFLLWGVGLGLPTPAVVAAAVPGERAGPASAVNNTVRRTGGAGVGGLYLAAGVLALALLPGALLPGRGLTRR